MNPTISELFDRIREAVVYDAARKANQAILDLRAEAEHIRRSLGQKVRWQKARIG